MKNLTIIAAVGKNLELGKDNNLIWRFKEDMKFFRENTTGKPILMGRKTLESLPKLLPNRTHVVLTRNGEGLDKEIIVVHSLDEALDYVKAYQEEVMVIGGASIYSEFLEYSDKLILTEIDAECLDADKYFPTFNKDEYNVEIVGEHKQDNIKFKHLIYTKKTDK